MHIFEDRDLRDQVTVQKHCSSFYLSGGDPVICIKLRKGNHW